MKQQHIEKIRTYVSHIQLSLLLQFAFVCALIVLGCFVFIDEEIEDVQLALRSTSGQIHNPFNSLEIEAEAVYVFDMKTGDVLFAKNESNVYALASITKIATALTAHKLAEGNTDIHISAEAIQVDGDNGLLANENWKLSDLLDFTLLVSSNDGAYGVASVAGGLLGNNDPIGSFVDEMNMLAEDIGLNNTRFYNPTGLDIDNQRTGGYGTVKDVALLMEYALEHYPELLEVTKNQEEVFVSLDNIVHQATNTNPIVGSIPGLLASKTGFTRQSGGNLVIALDPFPGRPVIIAVLGSTYDGRFDDVYKLSEAAVSFIREEQ